MSEVDLFDPNFSLASKTICLTSHCMGCINCTADVFSGLASNNLSTLIRTFLNLCPFMLNPKASFSCALNKQTFITSEHKNMMDFISKDLEKLNLTNLFLKGFPSALPQGCDIFPVFLSFDFFSFVRESNAVIHHTKQ